jgi:hypothetical protein
MNERYILKHKNINTAIVSFNDDGEALSIDRVIDARHLPAGIVQERKIISSKYLSEWWNDRGIPRGRQGRENLLRLIGEKKYRSVIIKRERFKPLGSLLGGKRKRKHKNLGRNKLL